MPLPKRLFSAVEDFAKLKGPRYTPEQTQAALRKLVARGETREGKMYRRMDIDSLKDTGLLEDPNVERAYAVGSSVTGKEIPSDLDILARGRTGVETKALQQEYSGYKSPHPAVKADIVHTTTPVGEESFGDSLQARSAEAMNASSARTAYKMAEEGVKKHGEDHQWIRLVAIPAAVGLGILAPGEKDQAEAGLVSGLRKLLNTPVTRRGFVKGAIEEGKDLNLLKRAKSTGKDFFGQNREVTATNSTVGIARQRGSDYFSLYEEAGGPGAENLKLFKDTYKKYFPDMQEKDIERIHTLAAPEDQSTINQAGDLLLYKLLSIPGVNKKDILNILNKSMKEDLAWARTHPGYNTDPEFHRGLIEEVLNNIENLGVTFTNSGVPKIPKNKMKVLEQLADSVKSKVIEGGVEVGSKVAEELGKKEMSRRDFFKGFGLGKGAALVGGATVASQLGGEPEAEAAFKPEAIAKAVTSLIKQNAQRLKNPEMDKELVNFARGTMDDPGPFGLRTPTRVGGVISDMVKTPSKEYSYFDELIVKPTISWTPGVEAKGLYESGLTVPDYQKKWPSKLTISSKTGDPGTFPHEVVHARQNSRPGVARFLDELGQHVNKWEKNPMEQYYKNPAEKHAFAMEERIKEISQEELSQTLYDQIYNQELHKAVQYTEKWLQHLDPTFRARFIKNVAIGGAVATALQLGPESEADAMPRGIYEKVGKLMGEVSSAAKELVGKETEPGKIIKTILKGKGRERTVIFEDGTQSVLDTNDVTKLARGIGTETYRQKFLAKEPEGQLSQAIKSMQIHEAMAQNKTFTTRATTRRYTEQYLQQLGEMGKTLPPDTVFVEKGSLLFTMPRFYAELLEKNGMLNIVKSKKYLDITNKNKVK